MDCIFCKIVAGVVPSYKVYEDESTLAFLDIAPVNSGHTLVIPKKHFADLEEISGEELCKVMKTVKKVGKAVKNNLGIVGYNVVSNNDPIAGQIVPHLHFHVVPRTEKDDFKAWPQGEYGEGEAEEILKKLSII